jgi:hypothetical protein
MKRTHNLGQHKGPALVIEHPTEGWRVFSGSYKTNTEAKADADKVNKKRKDGAVAKAGRWENWRKS